jgi:alpha-1,2-mannosyltransferase
MSADPARLRRAALPVLALAVPAMTIAAVLWAAGSTLGYDYLAYDAAARRVLLGRPLYDLSYAAAGSFGLFYYPPSFILLVLPFAALFDAHVATLVWIATLLAAFGTGVAVLPVRVSVRWAVLLLAGLSWPFLYALKLGQVGPLLFLVGAVTWRCAERPALAGTAIAAGAAIKVQPILLLGWALVTRRWRAFLAGLGVLGGLSGLATIVAGTGAWPDFVTLLLRVSDPIDTPDNLTVGAIAFRAGLPREVAASLQVASIGLVALVTVWAWVRSPAPTAIVVTAVASQLVSPIVWAHYAVILLLPVALLLERRHWWAAALPIVTWLPMEALYPIVFAIGLVAPITFSATGLGPGRRASVISTRS